jgi:3-oxoacid CoA-transferase
MLSRKFLKNTLKRSFAQVVTAEQAVSHIAPGSTMLSGGFGVCGNPNSIIKEIAKKKINNLTVVSNNAGLDTYGLGLLLNDGLVKRMISSYVGENAEFERQYLNGELELEITPQGTLAEKIRSGGKGIPGFWTATGADTLIETGGFPIKWKEGGKVEEIISEAKETRVINGNNFSQNIFSLTIFSLMIFEIFVNSL